MPQIYTAAMIRHRCSSKRIKCGPLQLVIAGLLASAGTPAIGQDQLTVLEVLPARHSLVAATDGDIVVDFDRPVAAASVTPSSFWAFGRWSGVVEGTLILSNGDRRVTLTPDRRLSAGETV